MTTLKKLKRNPILLKLSSIKIACVCLSFLLILTLWGTVAQVNMGLYAAQQKFFFSWWFLEFGFLPFPGTRLILWILFINLLSVSITRFVYRVSHIGILIIHIGLLMYFVSAFVTFHVTEESHVTLLEGETTNVSTSYFQWELAAWETSNEQNRNVFAVDSENLKPGTKIALENLDAVFEVSDYYKNAAAYTDNKQSSFLNASGIAALKPEALDKENEKNLPGLMGSIKLVNEDKSLDILLYGGEVEPVVIETKKGIFYLQLRRKRFLLPFSITLNDFKKEVHPGTDTPSSFESDVDIVRNDFNQRARIYMNHPLRYRDYTLYQASYSIDEMGRERSTFATVKNSGRLLPYITSLVTFFGLAFHFLMGGINRKKKSKN